MKFNYPNVQAENYNKDIFNETILFPTEKEFEESNEICLYRL